MVRMVCPMSAATLRTVLADLPMAGENGVFQYSRFFDNENLNKRHDFYGESFEI